MSEKLEETSEATAGKSREIAAACITIWHGEEFDTLRPLLADASEYLAPLARADGAAALRKSLDSCFDLHTTIALPSPVANWIHVEDGKIDRIRAV
ncbi:hypothetical protein ACWCWQ_04785 [Streptomyces sp. NPDC001571]